MRGECAWIECGQAINAYSRADALFCSPQCRWAAKDQRKRYEAFSAALSLIRPTGRFRSKRRS